MPDENRIEILQMPVDFFVKGVGAGFLSHLP